VSRSPSSAPLATIYRGSVAAGSVAIGLGIGLILLAGYLVFSFQGFSGSSESVPVFLFLAIFPGLFVLVGLFGIRTRLRIFDEGVEGRGLFAPSRFVPFSEAVALRWSTAQGRIQHHATHVFVKARVRGTQGSTGFVVPESADPNTLVWARDRLSEAIAGRALEALQRGESFAWGGVSLQQDGILRRDGTLVPYSTPFRLTWNGNGCSVAIAASGETVLKAKARSLNFYPGWTLFYRLAPTVEHPEP
jgi:hypothetical protein